MEHLSDNQLLDILNREPDGNGPAHDHVAECPTCRQRLEILREPWDALGQWTVDDPGVDLTARIMTQARPIRTIRLWQGRALGRIAATILIGLGLGALAGRPKPAPVSEGHVAEAMYLDALALHSATGWASPLLTEAEEG